MSFAVTVDATNPGQFFACCGLLELADRLWPGAEGWFEGREFKVTCEGDFREVLTVLVQESPEEVRRLDCGLEVPELIAPLRFAFSGRARALTLDAWIRVKVERNETIAVGNPPWNFWSGQQTSAGIWAALRQVLASDLSVTHDVELPELFSRRRFQKGRFGFDPGPAWNALDVGFSPNTHELRVESCAAVELLAAVGIQRFRPKLLARADAFRYTAWLDRLPVQAACGAACGMVSVGALIPYECDVISRGKYSALGHSRPIYRSEHERPE